MVDRSTVQDTLSALAHPLGGWGYAPNQLPHLEPTCLALLALTGDQDRHRTVIDAGLRFISENALPNGGYRLARDDLRRFGRPRWSYSRA